MSKIDGKKMGVVLLGEGGSSEYLKLIEVINKKYTLCDNIDETNIIFIYMGLGVLDCSKRVFCSTLLGIDNLRRNSKLEKVIVVSDLSKNFLEKEISDLLRVDLYVKTKELSGMFGSVENLYSYSPENLDMNFTSINFNGSNIQLTSVDVLNESGSSDLSTLSLPPLDDKRVYNAIFLSYLRNNGYISITFIQRVLNISFPKAGLIMEELKTKGYVSKDIRDGRFYKVVPSVELFVKLYGDLINA